MTKTWFITGAGRGLGTEIAKAALAAGDNVVATARDTARLAEALGPDDDRLLNVALDVTAAGQAQAAVDAAEKRFGGIDVLVNNAGYGHLGFFEEASEEDIRIQFETNLFGVFRVTRAALPAMRKAGHGRIFNLSSVGGLRGAEFGSLYCSTKFALEGFSESLAQEVAPFGIFVTIVEPGPFRTDFLTPESLRFGGQAIADYAARRETLRASYEQRNGHQPGDPVRLARALVRLAAEQKPPLRFLGGAMALETAKAKLAGMGAEFERWRDLALATDYPA
ncbi:MAG TPA: oxidoreductase [Dongiaceae bacterium]|jgi:NAD(P)-dependent dehydrogenase (short-subunit alcohol dehydrogenase family)|nr:oxidoreductase [Dongiaceae bacterium]